GVADGARAGERAGRAALRAVFDGRDADPEAIRAARENAPAAGLRDAIRWEVRDIAQPAPTADPQADAGASRGLVVCNPPYDARLAADPALYRALCDALRGAVPGWRARPLCVDRELVLVPGPRV